MAAQGYLAGYISIALGVLFMVLLTITIVAPGTATLSTGAVVVGVGTIVSVIVLAVFLMADR